MRNPSFGSMGREMMMRAQSIVDPMRQRMAGQQAPQQTAVSMPSMQNMVAPQVQLNQGYQGMNPMAMAQMLRGRFGGAKPSMSNAFGTLNPNAIGNVGLNPNAGDIYGGINPLGSRQAFMNFINSMNKG